MRVLALFLLMSVALLANPVDPGACALQFLEKIRNHSLNLDPGGDTALSGQTTDPKRKEIARRLERVASELGRDPLELGEVKIDDDLAAVLVHKHGGFDPRRLEVVPVALVRRAGRWLAAPVPGSFENAGVSYTSMIRQRLTALEDWMLRQQASELQQLRESSDDRLRREITAVMPVETIRAWTPHQAMARFLSACANRRLPEILGFLGALEDSPPEDWPQRLQAADQALAVASDQSKTPWRILLDPRVLRVPVGHDADGSNGARIALACLDPAATSPASRLSILHLGLARVAGGLWRIDLPERFFATATPPNKRASDANDEKFLDLFPAKFAEQAPPRTAATVEDASAGLQASWGKDDLTEVLRWVGLDGDPKQARDACVEVARLWWATRDPAAGRHSVPLDLQVQDGVAAHTAQVFSIRDSDRLDLRVLYFVKSASGWQWSPRPDAAVLTRFRDWVAAQEVRWRDAWRERFLVDSQCLVSFPVAEAPASDEARRLLESWFQALRARDLPAALRLTAHLSGPQSRHDLLRNLGYEMSGSQSASKDPQVLQIERGKTWTTVGARCWVNGDASLPVYPVVATPAGPRILLETDFVVPLRRARELLNRSALDRLRAASPSTADELVRLLEKHRPAPSDQAAP